MKRRPLWPLLPPLAVLMMAALALLITHLTSGAGTSCGFRKLTSLHCPGCGGTRCAYDILRGNLLGAFSHNALAFTGFFVFLLGSGYLIIRMTILGKPAPQIPNIKAFWLWYVLAGVVMFTVLRNVPAWPFSLLAP